MFEKQIQKIFIISSLALFVYMPFSLFFSRWLSLYTGGCGPWDISKDVVTAFCLFLALIIAIRKGYIKERYILAITILGALYGLLHIVFYFTNKNLDSRSLFVGLLFNGRVLAYLYVGILLGKVLSPKQRVWLIKAMVVTTAITALFALAQYAPKDLMTHFGYSIKRGVRPAFFIDNKPDFPRVMSTIQAPNSYGAFLVLPVTFIVVLLLEKKRKAKKLLMVGLLILFILAMLLTFSRGALIGTIISLVIAIYLSFKRSVLSFIGKHLVIFITIASLLVVGGLVGRHTYVIDNLLLHKDKSTVLTDPNELRIQFQKRAIKNIIHTPFGHGPGTAGLVAIGNPKGGILTENYYLQIAYEVGILGLAIFLAILILVYRRILRASKSHLQLTLVASFWGLAFIATLIHLWSNEAVAMQWWTLAGLVSALPLVAKPKSSKV